MRATELQKKFWKEWHQHGDFIEIAESTGNKISRITIGDAYHSGIGTEQVINAINAFYMNRKKRMEVVDETISKISK